MNRSPIQWFLTIAGLSGIASIFLKFTWDVSPFRAALTLFEDTFPFGSLWVLGAPFLLSIVISASLIRWNLTGRLSLLELIVTYLIGLSVMAVVIRTNFGIFHEPNHERWMSVIFSAGFLIAGIFLVIRNHRLGEFKNLSPIMLMQTAYLGNGILLLIGFWGGWQIGAYFAVVTVIVYAAQMALISCQKKAISAVKPQGEN